MKKVGDLMKEIGFNSKGSDAVKEAFVKNLIKQAYGQNVPTPSENRIISANPGTIVSIALSEKSSLPAQMAFDFEESNLNPIKKRAI